MICTEAFPFLQDFLESLNQQLGKINPKFKLSQIQKAWIAFCIVGIWVTGSLCWKRFEKYSLGARSVGGLSWMLRHSLLAWQFLLIAGVRVVLKKYSLNSGHLVLDDTDRQRSKSTTRIAKVHRIHDKKTGGSFMGQNLVFLLLVTDKITLPVGFKFYQPDPKKTEWNAKDEELRKHNVPKSQRPSAPKADPSFPSKIQIAIDLLSEFQKYFPDVSVRSISADAAFGSGHFFESTGKMYPGTQIISQLRSNQTVVYKNTRLKVSDVFAHTSPRFQTVSIRGGEKEKVFVSYAKVFVEAHEETRMVIALKYENEAEFRYVVASEMDWRVIDIVQAYSLRWLVEVFFFDWKGYEGWGQLALQQGVEGSHRSVVLSLLVDLCLLFHPDQFRRIQNKQPACTVGSLRDSLKNESLLASFRQLLLSEDPLGSLDKLQRKLVDLFRLEDSSKHMSGRNIESLRASSLIKRAFGRVVFGYV